MCSRQSHDLREATAENVLQGEKLTRIGRTIKLTALPGAETNHKHTDSMPAKSKSKTPSDPAVDRAAPCSPVVAWQKGILRVHDKDDLDCTDVHVLTIDGRTVLRAIVPVHGLGVPVSDADRKLIGQALAEYLANV